ncbi:SCO1/SenC [Calidithermus terrae]|uniref:SCO1/SenC n=1 Tax=Calidithermus terrae TaxID=1408545 RepID=A0A399E079_9DEIN|nr:SCO family protein [Calidithermus terrae]RIH75870.1 SCO1/SenC [Calidithermus terrae]
MRALALAVLLSAALAHGGHYLPLSGAGVQVMQSPKPLPAVELVDAAGRAVSFPPKGQAWALYLGYTRCPDSCPLTLERLRQAHRGLGSPAGVRLGFLSLDPQHDTPAVLGRYLKGFEPVVGFTGTPEAVARAAGALEVRYNPAPGGVRLYHTDVVVLLDARGRVLRLIYGASRLSAAQLAGELQRLGGSS